MVSLNVIVPVLDVFVTSAPLLVVTEVTTLPVPVLVLVPVLVTTSVPVTDVLVGRDFVSVLVGLVLVPLPKSVDVSDPRSEVTEFNTLVTSSE